MAEQEKSIQIINSRICVTMMITIVDKIVGIYLVEDSEYNSNFSLYQ